MLVVPEEVGQYEGNPADDVRIEDEDAVVIVENNNENGNNNENENNDENNVEVIHERRYPDRNRRQPEHLRDYVVEDQVCNVDFCYIENICIPNTYEEAVQSLEADNWKEAMDDEINSLQENEMYMIVPLPKDKQAVGGRWVYTVKVGPGGEQQYKARYVAKGFTQKHGYDYFETFAPTAKMTTVRMFMQIAVEFDLIIHQMDVKTAYLNAPIDCEIYMNQPKGYEQFSDRKCKMVCKLQKSIYGLKQSGRNWNIVLHNFFKDNGFTQSLHDPCIYLYNSNSEVVIVLIWVDDIVVAANSMICLNKTKDLLKMKFYMKDLGPISCFLGIRFKQVQGLIIMDQSQYLQSKLVKYGMDKAKPRSTPCELSGYVIDSSDDNQI